MYGSEDGFGPTLASAAVTATLGYFDGTWVKKKPGSLWPTITRAAVGIGGLGFHNYIRRPYINAMAEGAGYGGLYGTGLAIAANTTTIGGVPAGALQMNRTSTAGAVIDVRRRNGGGGNRGGQVPNTMSPWDSGALVG